MKLDLKKCIHRIDEYNRGTYRGRRNVDLDRHGYKLFGQGLPSRVEQIQDLVKFIGEDYGGAQARFLPKGFSVESNSIATAIALVAEKYQSLVRAQDPLRISVPRPDVLQELLKPFFATKLWLVWASKFLHFLAPETFAVYDSRAAKALSFSHAGDPVQTYSGFLYRIRDDVSGIPETSK